MPATATFMPETESPYKSKTGGAGFMTRPLKRKWGKVLPDKFKPGRGLSGDRCGNNSNHGTRLSWGAGLNSARLEREAPRYNSI